MRLCVVAPAPLMVLSVLPKKCESIATSAVLSLRFWECNCTGGRRSRRYTDQTDDKQTQKYNKKKDNGFGLGLGYRFGNRRLKIIWFITDGTGTGPRAEGGKGC